MLALPLLLSLTAAAPYTTPNAVLAGFHLDSLPGKPPSLLVRAGNALIGGVAYQNLAPTAYVFPPPLDAATGGVAPGRFYYCYVSPVFAFACSSTQPFEDGTPSAVLTVARNQPTSDALCIGSFFVDLTKQLATFYRNGNDVTVIEPQQIPVNGPPDPFDPGLPAPSESALNVAATTSGAQWVPAMSDVILLNTHFLNGDANSGYTAAVDQPLLTDEQGDLSVGNSGASINSSFFPAELTAAQPFDYNVNFHGAKSPKIEVYGIQRGYLEPIHAFEPNYKNH